MNAIVVVNFGPSDLPFLTKAKNPTEHALFLSEVVYTIGSGLDDYLRRQSPLSSEEGYPYVAARS